MYSGKRKQRAKRTKPAGKGLVPLTEREANQTVGGTVVQPDISDSGGANSNILAHRLQYEQG